MNARNARRWSCPPAGRWLPALLAVSCAAAHADPVQVLPRAEALWEHTDNLFLVPSDPALQTVRPLASDTLTTLVAGLEISQEDRASADFLRAEARRLNYSGFHQFNHDEYDVSAGYTAGSQQGNHLSAELGLDRKLVPFLSLTNNNAFSLEKQRYARLTGQVQVGEVGRVDAMVERNDTHSPVPGAPDYAVAEDVGRLGLTRGVPTTAEYGARVRYAQGHYTGQPIPVGDYRQWNPELFLNRRVKGLIDLELAAGMTDRHQDRLGDVRGGTGSANLLYHFTPRTNAYVGATRNVAGYYATAGSQVSTSWFGGASWAATTRITLQLDYSHTDANYAVVGIPVDRNDKYYIATASLKWQVTRLVALSAFARKQKRDSNDPGYFFDESGAGASVRVALPGRAR